MLALTIIILLIVNIFALSLKVPEHRGTFLNPKTGPKWRYWIQDAFVDPQVLRRDVAEMARVGSSGFELLSYQSYGRDVLIDPTDVAFGSDAFVNVTKTLAQAAKLNGLTIDFSLGPDQGAGVPVKPEDVDQEGMLTELVFGSHFLNPGESFDGPLPDPVIVPFLDAEGVIRSANTTEKFLVAVVGAQLVKGQERNASRVSLDFGSVVDLTDQVQTDGSSVSWTPDTDSDSESVLLAYYYRRSGYPEARGGFNGTIDSKPGSWGSFVIDHFSAQGANVSSSFIERNILSRQGIGELLAEPGVGGYMWEDSMEFETQVWWTPGFAERYEERHGYSVNKALPVFHALVPGSAVFSEGIDVNQTFDYGGTTNAWALTEDYRDTLTSLYAEYMLAFNTWSSSIGLQFSNQPAYDFQLDVAASAAIPAVPEIESLSLPLIDQARQLSGGVHLGNKSIFSSETGARFGLAMAITMTQLLEDSKNQFAGHVNVVMIHGYPYGGDYPGTTWPGLCTFSYNFADMHGPRMPAWGQYDGYMSYLARNQYVLQSGVPKVDVALYRRAPENFKLPGVSVSWNGRLAINGPAYKAFVLSRIQNVTVDAAEKLVEFAEDGLPIVIVGGVPRLTALPVVRVVDDEEAVPGALESLGVSPVARTDPPSASLHTIRRDRDENATVSHFFLYNQNNVSINFTLTLEATGTPFILDAWSGDITPVAIWNATDEEHITIPGVQLAANQTMLFAVTSEDSFEGVSAPSVHISSADSDAFALSSSSEIEIRSFTEGSKEVVLSNGQRRTVNLSLGGEIERELTGWQLNITAWTPPADLNQVDSVLVPHPVIDLSHRGLVPWDQLDGHENTSGVGTYTTPFEWAHDENGGVGAQLDFGVVVHTLKAWLNGEVLPTADLTRPVVDITSLVREGTNVLRVDVASTLLNAVNAAPQVRSLGQLRTDTLRIPLSNQHYGLVVPVRLIPYGRETIGLDV
ncbi:hypothetical protein PM082_008267 [Marasmius tenuissimus]|nr:hypothetical protein PM082_008267 [Marasmius tenuissimus]